MPDNVFLPSDQDRYVQTPDGKSIAVPDGWDLLHPGDAAMTRRVKAAGEFWLVQEKKGRRTFSKGLWAPAETISKIRADLEAERSTEAYTKRRESDLKRRKEKQAHYVDDFHQAVLAFLNFHPSHSVLAEQLAVLVTKHATPVGSGTVARTSRIPIERRAEAAVIAWMRHQTTAYDSMKIPRVRGKRREVRRMLARRSNEILQSYRDGSECLNDCPLASALGKLG